MTAVEHEHEFAGPPTKDSVRCCVDRRCIEWRVGTGTEWRELTRDEHTQLTILLWEDLLWVDVAKIIHGERWREWFELIRGHRPAEVEG